MNILNLSPEELIAKAIAKEQDAYNLYRAYSNIIEDRAASQMLKELAEEELKHKEILEGIDISVFQGFSIFKIKNHHLTDFMETHTLDKNSSLQNVLTFAIKREEDSKNFYLSFADICNDDKARRLLNKLAKIEMGHKIKLENLYEKIFMPED